MKRKNETCEEDEVMRRCRRVRKELYGRFRTRDEKHAWLMSLERQRKARRGTKKIEFGVNDEVMLRCRRVRDELNKKFKTVEALCDYFNSLEKQPRKGRAAKRATASKRGTKRPGRSGKPTQKKPAHKA